MLRKVVVLHVAWGICLLSAGSLSRVHAADLRMIDPRDGRGYRVATVGGHVWMAENLGFDAERSVCYGDSAGNCLRYGRLYDWEFARSACPRGWRLPLMEDWGALVLALGGPIPSWRSLDAAMNIPPSAWRSTDSMAEGNVPPGFHALAGGFWDGSFRGEGSRALFWSATPGNTERRMPWYRSLSSREDRFRSGTLSPTAKLSVRCVEDGPRPDTAPKVSRGTMVDPRDRRRYPTVTIGHQAWMARNLEFRTDSSWCYRREPGQCRRYGRLYTFGAAVKACPEGWHLPSRRDWLVLDSVAGGDYRGALMLMARRGWTAEVRGAPAGAYGGTDAYGFAALPGGSWSVGGNWNFAGYRARFWSADSFFAFGMNIGIPRLMEIGYSPEFAFSVRCLREAEGQGNGQDSTGRGPAGSDLPEGVSPDGRAPPARSARPSGF